MDPSDSITAPSPATPNSAAYRALLAAVILLGVLIVIALGMLVAGFAMRLGGHVPAPPAPVQFTLAPGSRIVSMEVSGDRIILRLRGPAGDEIDVIDAGSGRLIARLRSAPPRP